MPGLSLSACRANYDAFRTVLEPGPRVEGLKKTFS